MYLSPLGNWGSRFWAIGSGFSVLGLRLNGNGFRCQVSGVSAAAGPPAKKTAILIEKETFYNSDTAGFTITPTSLVLTETAENIFISPQAIWNPYL
jgi:hypothetical protein